VQRLAKRAPRAAGGSDGGGGGGGAAAAGGGDDVVSDNALFASGAQSHGDLARAGSDSRMAFQPAAGKRGASDALAAAADSVPRHVALARASSFRAPSVAAGGAAGAAAAPAPAAAGPTGGARAAAEFGLLPGWAPVWSKSRAVFYWRHDGTGEVTWDKPAQAVESAAAAAEVETAAGVRAFQASKAGQVNAEVGLPDGWKAVWSTSRAVWYWRSEAGEVSWTKPARLAAAKSARSLGVGSGGGGAADPAAAAEAEAKADLPPGWTAVWSRSRAVWYWRRGEDTSWTKPAS